MTDITPERMSEETQREIFNRYHLSSTATAHDAIRLLAHIAWQAGQNAELRQELTFREEALAKLKADLHLAHECIEGHNFAAGEAIKERDAAKAECERLRAENAEDDKSAIEALIRVSAERDDARAANDLLGQQIARLTEEAAGKQRLRDAEAAMMKGVWADHEKQFAEQAAEIARLRDIIASVRAWAAAAGASDKICHEITDLCDSALDGKTS